MIAADKETRLGIFAIDNFVFLGIVMIHSLFLETSLFDFPEGRSVSFALYLVFIYFNYYFLFEYFFQKTPGKFLTKTMVVEADGTRPEAQTLFWRSLGRLIPFDVLSFLFGQRGWHDSISRTMVVHD